jgi:hypothetical protein
VSINVEAFRALNLIVDRSAGTISGTASFPATPDSDWAKALREIGFDASIFSPGEGQFSLDPIFDLFAPVGGACVVQPTQCGVEGRFESNNSGEIKLLRLCYKLPEKWKFSDTFPRLPAEYVAGGTVSPLIDRLLFTDASVYLSTHAQEVQFGGVKVPLRRGLTFVGKWRPLDVLGIFGEILKKEQRRKDPELVMHGPIVFPTSGVRADAVPAVPFKDPYGPVVPGINLKADLGIAPNIGEIRSSCHTFGIYTRLWASGFDNARVPSAAYECRIEIGKDISTDVNAIMSLDPGADVILSGRFTNATLKNLGEALLTIAGGSDCSSVLPEEAVADKGIDLELQEASVHLMGVLPSADGESASATLGSAAIWSTSFTIGLRNAWRFPVVKNLLEIELNEVQVLVASPFVSELRSVMASIRGKVFAFGVQLDVTVRAPDFYVSAEQVAGSRIRLKEVEFFKKFPTVPDVEIDHITLMAARGGSGWYYAFSMRVASNPWSLSENTTFALEFGLSNSAWQLTGSGEGGRGLPIGELIKQLSKDIEFLKHLETPSVDALVVQEFSVTYGLESKEFAFSVEGRLPINATEVDIALYIRLREQPYAKELSGRIKVCDLEFDLVFDARVEATAVIAAYHDSKGRALTLQDFFNLVWPNVAPDVPSKPSLSVKEAVFVYDKSEKPEKLLFGAKFDVNLAIDLDRTSLKALAGHQNQALGIEDLTVLVATSEFTATRISAINSTRNLSFKVPSVAKEDGEGGLAKGPHIRGTLKLGKQEPFPLSAPIAGNSPPVPGRREAGKPSPQGLAKWFEVGKSLGPLHVGRVGLQYAHPKIGLLLDASLDLAGLHVGLTGFGLHVPLSGPPQETTLGLDGLDLAYRGGPAEIVGAFLRQTVDGGPDRYEGIAVLKASSFAVTGIGSFTTVGDKASIFIFAALHAELGGPPAFRLQGIAAGFGYNRKLTLPPVNKVHEFPLVRAALEESFLRKDKPEETIGVAMSLLADYVVASPGDYWIAAGIKFNSFELVTSAALLTVSFGNDVELGLLGLMKMQLPRGADATPIAYAELALRASFRPRDGVLIIEGALTEASYILSKNCKITGGFAVAFWFSGPHKGDFVISLGGYHPAFQKPEHYPAVPRLGIQWQVTSELVVNAELYFALTPTCIMTGGRLVAVYTTKTVRAWFIVYADFLIAWRPLRYRTEAGIRIGAEFDLGSILVRVDLQARIRIWGPPFAGQLDIDLGFLVASITFGAIDTGAEPIDAIEFKKAFLPADAGVLAARIESGLLREEGGHANGRGAAAPASVRIVTAHALTLAVESLVPVTKIAFTNNNKAIDHVSARAHDLGVRPMASATLRSTLTLKIVSVHNGDGREEEPITLRTPRLELIDLMVPDALWLAATPEQQEKRQVPPVIPKPASLKATVGARIALLPVAPKSSLPRMRLEKLGPEDTWHPMPAARPQSFGLPTASGGIEAAMDPATVSRRRATLEVLARQSPFQLNSVNLRETARLAKFSFQADPILCPLGSRDERAELKAA